MKKTIDQLIEKAHALSPLEEAEQARLEIQQGGIGALPPSDALEVQVEPAEKAAGVISVDDVWKPFAIERVTEPMEKPVEEAPKSLLGHLSRWYRAKKTHLKPAAEVAAPKKKGTIKRLIRDGFFQFFLFFLRWMLQRTVRYIKKNL